MNNWSILLIEGNSRLLKALTTALVNADLDVRTALNGAQALELAKRYKPKIIIFDPTTSSSTGGLIMKRLATLQEDTNCQVILLTEGGLSFYARHELVETNTTYISKAQATASSVVEIVKKLSQRTSTLI